jgi:formate hydrogenlyase subunit 6/NADH:ubiquinone oxidoreductase subunit I
MLQSLKHIFLLSLLSILVGTAAHAQCTLTATSSGENAAYTQVYVLVDASNNNIIAQNTIGTFTSVAVGNYNIHALNYDPSNSPAPLPDALIGMPVSDVGSTTAGCFNADFLTDLVTRNCPSTSCAQSSDVCENTPIIATSSGGNATYTQVYVLADDSGNFLVQNSTGTFATVSLSTGNTYQVHALNYDPNDLPTTLPSDLSTGDPLSNITGGCFNADFLTDFVCFNLVVCVCIDVCSTNSITATSSGGNAAYTQVYVLADDTENFVAQNSTGNFSAASLTVGNTYNVHALNYDPNNVPTTLPSDLSVGDPLSNITGGCFNSNFLTDIVCFNIITCACTDVCNTAFIIATSSSENAAYTQVYVLADDSGNFVDQNGTGAFPAAPLTIGNTYQVHALNYDPNNSPTTLPSDLVVGDPLSDVTGGCFNSDFLTDYVCFDIICCGGPTGFLR